jgi:hypothetical protein
MTPRRRTLLVLAGSTLAGLAGCAGDSSPDPSDGSPGETPERTPEDSKETDETPENDPTPTDNDSADEGMSVQVDISPASYLVGAMPAAEFPSTARDITEPESVSTFPDPLADALRQAEDGGFETDEPSEALLAVLDQTRERPYRRLTELAVRIDGTAYVATLQFPELEVELADEIVTEYDPERVASEDGAFEADEVETLVGRIGWDGTPETARSRYVTSRVSEDIEAFLDRYEYVEDYKGVSPIRVQRHNWEPPYSITLREFTVEDRWGRDVFDIESLDEDLQAFLRTAVESEGWLRSPPLVTDDVPESYFETFRTDDESASPDNEREQRPLVRVGGDVYRITVSEGTHERMPVSVTAAPATATDSGLARFTVTVEVTDDNPGVAVATGEPVELYSQIGLPSGLWVTDDGHQHLLDSDRYEVPVERESDGTWSLALADPELGETSVNEALAVGETLTATYTVPSTVPAGSYTLSGNFAARWEEPDSDHQSGLYPYEIALTLEED